ncbi:MAG: helix-turn-helix transcriptional regulator [Alphaproteobacteria bacterium]|nr:helix-turn-helix transcriptional regulator [Alphaproteobacteria bacterium]
MNDAIPCEAHWGTLHVGRVQPHTPRPEPAVHPGHALQWSDGDPSTFLLIPAGTPHRCTGGVGADWVLGFCAHCVGLDDSPLLATFERVRCGAAPVVQVEPTRSPWIRSLFLELEEECRRTGGEAQALQTALLQLLLREIHRGMGAPDAQAGATLTGQALTYIWSNALRPISLQDVARHVHRSPKHVATEVKRATGSTVGDWIRATRIEAAANWLLHTDDSVEQIAERVGWSDTSHFIRQFRKIHGRTPAVWRRSVRAEGG